jgi:hypothetical protein
MGRHGAVPRRTSPPRPTGKGHTRGDTWAARPNSQQLYIIYIIGTCESGVENPADPHRHVRLRWRGGSPGSAPASRPTLTPPATPPGDKPPGHTRRQMRHAAQGRAAPPGPAGRPHGGSAAPSRMGPRSPPARPRGFPGGLGGCGGCATRPPAATVVGLEGARAGGQLSRRPFPVPGRRRSTTYQVDQPVYRAPSSWRRISK